MTAKQLTLFIVAVKRLKDRSTFFRHNLWGA